MKQKILSRYLFWMALMAAALIAFFIFQPFYVEEQEHTVTWSLDDHSVELTVAETEDDLQLGVGDWETIADDEGMLFELGALQVPGFWMKSVEFPLDLIWIKGYTVVDITERVQPEPGVPDEELQLYLPGTEVNRVIEVRSGFVDTYGIEIGDTIQLQENGT